MDEYCREKGYVDWFKTSAKENINIDEAAKRLVTKVNDVNFTSPLLFLLSRYWKMMIR